MAAGTLLDRCLPLVIINAFEWSALLILLVFLSDWNWEGRSKASKNRAQSRTYDALVTLHATSWLRPSIAKSFLHYSIYGYVRRRQIRTDGLVDFMHGRQLDRTGFMISINTKHIVTIVAPANRQ